MKKYLHILFTIVCLVFGNIALADGSINALGEIVFMALIATITILLLLAILISLLLNLLIFKNQKNIVPTFIGALAMSSIPVVIHGFGDYTIPLFITALLCSVLGGFAGYFVALKSGQLRSAVANKSKN